MFHILYPSPDFLSHCFSLCCWFWRHNPQWLDVPLNCVNQTAVIKKYSVSFICCFSVLIHWFYAHNSLLCINTRFLYLYVFLQCLNISLTRFRYNLTDWLEISKRHCRLVYKSSVAKTHNVTTNLSWTWTAAKNLLSIFTIFGLTKLISSTKSASAIQSFCIVHQLLGTSNLLANGYHYTQTSFCTRYDVGIQIWRPG